MVASAPCVELGSGIVEQGGGGCGIVKAPLWLSPCSPPHGCVFRNVWATLGCGILAVSLPADVATVVRVATSEEVSPRSDANLSRPG
ncbi:hypothetical protein Taro_041134 [Colocasia esculenta]|uniref:Uncharacterized protein n=1 Tax=Colocasia esculenta TaxID=4460 RepID=A0A843WF05_COLES|nr:hypothetical protein [Colocasia esculenta]